MINPTFCRSLVVKWQPVSGKPFFNKGECRMKALLLAGALALLSGCATVVTNDYGK